MNLTTGIRERVRTWVPLEDLLPVPYYLGVHRLIWREYYRDAHEVHDARKVEGARPGPAT